MVAGTALTTPARDSRVSRATAYRYPLRGPGGDRRPGPGPSRGPGSAARVGRAERRPGRDPDPHRPGGPGATRTRAATCGTQVLAGAFGGDVQVVMDFRRIPGLHGPGGARLHPRPDRGQTPRATGPAPVGPAGDAGPGGQGVPGRRDRHPRAHEEPPPDTGRADPQQPAVRHAGPGREGQCHVQALQGPATSLPRAPPPSPRSWPPPSSPSPSGTNPDTNPGEKGSVSRYYLVRS